ncbi:MAG: hypothetical protein J7604_06560 [Sporocytophaga sp.]|uniref:hypothetical protein n=1 Tax=Sporocytophaga sp. TaxID=2231183 RepID=UPI001B0D893A|nr:hypothetical protein [Sporocytophaga sp.]MBO9699855.1 hypothetical protein [Sporocytophaga sp.]
MLASSVVAAFSFGTMLRRIQVKESYKKQQIILKCNIEPKEVKVRPEMVKAQR